MLSSIQSVYSQGSNVVPNRVYVGTLRAYGSAGACGRSGDFRDVIFLFCCSYRVELSRQDRAPRGARFFGVPDRSPRRAESTRGSAATPDTNIRAYSSMISSMLDDRGSARLEITELQRPSKASVASPGSRSDRNSFAASPSANNRSIRD